MSTAIQGIVMNPHGFIPIRGVTIVAQSTDGYSEGTATTDSNGWFSLTGLSNKNWLAKITSAPPYVGNILLLPNYVDHADLSSVSADQHHAGFVGLLDNAGEPIIVDSNDLIQITDDGVINADLSDVGILTLSIDQNQIDHGSIDGTEDDDHIRYAQLGGRSGGQEIFGGVDDDENLTLVSNSGAVKGSVYLGDWTLFELAEATGQLLIPTTGASAGILLGGDALWYRSAADVMRTPDAVTVDGVLTASGGLTMGADIDMEGTNIEDGGVIFLREQAAADEDVADQGQIWVKAGDPNTLWWTDEDGTDVQLGAGGVHKDSHDPEDGADPLDTAAAGVIQPDDVSAEGSAHSFARSDHTHQIDCDTPSELVGVQAAGEGAAYEFARADHAHQIQASTADDHLVTVDDAAVGANEIAQFTATGVQGIADADVLALLSGDAGAAFDWNGQALTGVAQGIGDNAVITVDGAPADDEYARFTAAGLEGRDASEVVGDLSLNVPKRSIVIRAGGLVPNITDPCADAVQTETTTHGKNYVTRSFATNEQASMEMDIPWNYSGGTVTWWYKFVTPTGSSNGDTVIFGLRGSSTQDDDSMDEAPGAQVTSTYTLPNPTAAGDLAVSAESGALTIAGSPSGGDLVIWEIERTGGTMAEEAPLLVIYIRYPTDTYSDE